MRFPVRSGSDLDRELDRGKVPAGVLRRWIRDWTHSLVPQSSRFSRVHVHQGCLEAEAAGEFGDPLEIGNPDRQRLGAGADCEVGEGTEQIVGVLFSGLEPGNLESGIAGRGSEGPAGTDLPESAGASCLLEIVDGEPPKRPVDAKESSRRPSKLSYGP